MKAILSLLVFILVIHFEVSAQIVMPGSTDKINAPLTIDSVAPVDFIIVEHGKPIVDQSKYSTNQFQGAPANDDCSSAIALVVDAACVTGTTKSGGTQAGENFSCQGAPDQSVWYKFVATSANMYVEVNLTSSSGCYLSSAVWSGTCLPSTNLSCEDASLGPTLNIHTLTSLTVGATYYIQVSYNTGAAGCGTGAPSGRGADFCIDVGNSVICNTCAVNCGALCVFASQPTVAQVTSGCTEQVLKARMNAGDSRTQCYTFTANSTTFNMQMIVSSVGCSGGNVITFNWTLQSSGCGATLQSGDLSNLNATGLTIATNYVLCYTWVAACEHDGVWPYIVSNTPTPVEWLGFKGTFEMDRVLLEWSTASEINNNYFTVERSADGVHFERLGRLEGAGNSTQANYYAYTDYHPLTDISYYRIRQTDFDGKESYSSYIAINSDGKDFVHLLPNPVSDHLYINMNASSDDAVSIAIYNAFGQTVYTNSMRVTSGTNQFSVDMNNLSKGAYFLRVEYKDKTTSSLFMKE